MSKSSANPTIWTINGEYLRATLGLGLARLFWEIARPGVDLSAFLALIFAVAGAKRLVIALWLTGRFLLRHRREARFKAQGADPKADPMSKSDDLRAKGLTK